jgi:hypothetical protein
VGGDHLPSGSEQHRSDILRANVVIVGGSGLWETGETVPDLLWHYTDAAGALGILHGRAFWATHALFMNDASELRLAYPLLEEALEEAGKRVVGEEVLELLTVALSVMISRRSKDPDVYAVCFCEDGDLLSQWRAYGVSGGGYAIGVDARSMKTAADTTYALSLCPVVYQTDRQRMLAQEIVERTIRVFAQHMEAHPDDFDNAASVTARTFSFLAQTFASRIKDSAFREEQEWRLIYARDPNGPVATAARQFRSGTRGLVPFISIPLGVPAEAPGPVRLDLGLSDLPFRAVRVGPAAHPDLASLAMRYLLGDLKLEGLQVTTSAIPLRA